MKINRRSVLKILAALPWIGPALLKAKPAPTVLNPEWKKAEYVCWITSEESEWGVVATSPDPGYWTVTKSDVGFKWEWSEERPDDWPQNPQAITRRYYRI